MNASKTVQKGSAQEALSGRTPEDGPPPYDAEAVGRVAHGARLIAIELVALHFEQLAMGPLADEGSDASTHQQMGIGLEWATSPHRDVLGCAVDFSLLEGEDDDGAFELAARFRLSYALEALEPLTTQDIDQFAHWNIVYNAWPYWREIVGNVFSRTELQRPLVPLIGVPRPD